MNMNMNAFQACKTDKENFSNPELVLVQAPGWGVNTPSLATAMLTGHVRSCGYKVLPLDLNIDCYLNRKEKYDSLWELEQSLWFWNIAEKVDEFIADHKEIFETYVDVIIKANPKLVGFTIYGSCRYASQYIAKRIKEINPEIKTIFGGPHSSRLIAGKHMASLEFVDFVAQGEGELIIVDVLKKILSGEKIENCPGLLLKQEGKIVDCGDQKLITKLDDLGYSDFSDYDFQKYRYPFRLPMMSSRGCVNMCVFCNERPFWRAFRFMSGKRMFEEMKYQIEKNPGLNYVDFQDSLVNGSMNSLVDFADLIIESGLKIQWAGQAVIRKELTPEILAKLKKSGCFCLAFGLETSSSSLMLKVGKQVSKDSDPNKIVRDVNSAGIGAAYNFMFGLPGETEDDARETLEFLKRNRKHINTVNPSPGFCGFAPGTLAYDNPQKYGITNVESGQYWEADDGKNNYLVRLKRFEDFCDLVADLKIPTTYPSRQLLDREKKLGNYYYYCKEYSKAIPYYRAWLKKVKTDSIIKNKLINCYEQVGLKRMAEGLKNTLS